MSKGVSWWPASSGLGGEIRYHDTEGGWSLQVDEALGRVAHLRLDRVDEVNDELRCMFAASVWNHGPTTPNWFLWFEDGLAWSRRQGGRFKDEDTMVCWSPDMNEVDDLRPYGHRELQALEWLCWNTWCVLEGASTTVNQLCLTQREAMALSLLDFWEFRDV